MATQSVTRKLDLIRTRAPHVETRYVLLLRGNAARKITANWMQGVIPGNLFLIFEMICDSKGPALLLATRNRPVMDRSHLTH